MEHRRTHNEICLNLLRTIHHTVLHQHLCQNLSRVFQQPTHGQRNMRLWGLLWTRGCYRAGGNANKCGPRYINYASPAIICINNNNNIGDILTSFVLSSCGSYEDAGMPANGLGAGHSADWITRLSDDDWIDFSRKTSSREIQHQKYPLRLLLHPDKVSSKFGGWVINFMFVFLTCVSRYASSFKKL